MTLSGQKYLGNLDCGLNAAVGQWIEAEIQPSKDPKYPGWVGKWTFVSAAPSAPGPVPNAAPQVPPPFTPPQAAPAVAAPIHREPVYAEPSKNVAPWWMPFVSNAVAHAIQAGIITSPNQIKPWVDAARVAAVTSADDSTVPF